MMNETLEKNHFISSIKNSLSERSSSAMYGTFVITWCIWNWEAIYISVFINSNALAELYGILKIEYILSLYSWATTQEILKSLLWIIIGPTISTYVIIWHISKLDFFCFKKHYSSFISKKEEQLKQQKRILDKEKEILREKEEKVALEKKIEEEISDEEKWDNDYKIQDGYNNFKNALGNLKVCLYEYGGEVIKYNGYNNVEYRLPAEDLAILDTNGLIEFNDSRDKITATPKGKHFLKKELLKNDEQ